MNLTISPCPNDTFAFHALVHGLVPGAPPVEVRYADVDVTNTLALSADLDLVKVSYAALPWLLDRYALLPCGGALGRGCGPLLLTPGPRDSVDGLRIAVPGERTTAYLLLRLWMAGASPAAIDVVPFAEIMPAVAAGRYDAGLVIHEARFVYPRYGLTSMVDLGEWWEAATGLPIPLGAILARRGAVPLPDAAEWVRDSVAAAWAAPLASRDYVLSLAQEMEPAVVEQHIKLYVNDFTYTLGDEGHGAVRELLGRAASAGLVPGIDPSRLQVLGDGVD